MDLNELTKEQKQLFALGGGALLVSALLIFAGIRTGFAPARAAQRDLEGLTGQMDLAKRSLLERKKTREEGEEIAATLEGLLQNLPPEKNYYSWATEIIYSIARKVGLDVDAIDEEKRPSKKTKKSRKGHSKKAKIYLNSYTLKIAAHGNYEEVKQFLAEVERNHPMVRVIRVDIQAGDAPEVHDVKISMQWPFHLASVRKAWEGVANQEGSEESAESKR